MRRTVLRAKKVSATSRPELGEVTPLRAASFWATPVAKLSGPGRVIRFTAGNEKE
jgi:hypothetical protein